MTALSSLSGQEKVMLGLEEYLRGRHVVVTHAAAARSAIAATAATILARAIAPRNTGRGVLIVVLLLPMPPLIGLASLLGHTAGGKGIGERGNESIREELLQARRHTKRLWMQRNESLT